MSIQYPYSIGKVPNIFRFETVFHELASDCTKLTLSIGYHKSVPPLTGGTREDRLRVGGETNAWSQAHSSS